MYAIRRCRFAPPSVTQSGTVPPSYKFHGPIIVNSQLSIGSLFQSVKERRPFPLGVRLSSPAAGEGLRGIFIA